MITRERLEEIFSIINTPKFPPKTDRHMAALFLLRDKIPYEVCQSIIGGADHDKIFLCMVEQMIPYINEEDAYTLTASSCFLEDDCLSMFV